MIILEKGRPENTEGRLPKEIRSYDFLDSLKVEYDRADHEIAMTMEACAEIDKVLSAPTCKNLFLCNRQETSFYLLMIDADKVFKTKFLSSQLGVARLSFADEKYMEEFLDITRGSLTLLGLMNDKEKRVSLVIDNDLLKNEYIGLHPCINTSTLKISMKDILERVIPALDHTPVFVNLPNAEEIEENK